MKLRKRRKKMKMRSKMLKILTLTLLSVVLVGCASTSRPVNVTGLKNVVGTYLIGTRGATPRDQEKIDRTVARLCGASVYGRADCTKHGEYQNDN